MADLAAVIFMGMIADQNRGSGQMPAMVLNGNVKAKLARQLPDYKVLKKGNTLKLKKGEQDGFACLCPGCADVPYRFNIQFDRDGTYIQDDTSRFNMPIHKLNEISGETARVIAVIQTTLMMITPEEAPGRLPQQEALGRLPQQEKPGRLLQQDELAPSGRRRAPSSSSSSSASSAVQEECCIL